MTILQTFYFILFYITFLDLSLPFSLSSILYTLTIHFSALSSSSSFYYLDNAGMKHPVENQSTISWSYCQGKVRRSGLRKRTFYDNYTQRKTGFLDKMEQILSQCNFSRGGILCPSGFENTSEPSIFSYHFRLTSSLYCTISKCNDPFFLYDK